jgi:homoserine kinase type II
MTREEQIAVCSEFNLGDPVECKPLGGTRNKNFRLQTTNGEFVMRDRYVGYRDPARLAFDHATLRFLAERGVPVVAPIRSRDGATYWQQGDRSWEVFTAVVGSHFRESNIDDLRALATALASFHREGREFRQASSQKVGPRGETDPRELFRLVKQLKSDAPNEVRRYENWAKVFGSALRDERFEALPHTLVHGDIQPANVLINAGRVSAFIDFDWCDWRPRIYDLAFAILLCCAAHETPIDGGDIWSLSQPAEVVRDLASLFLNTYEEAGWALSREESSALGPQLFLSWCHVRLAGAMKIEPSRRAEFLARPPFDPAVLFPDGII